MNNKTKANRKAIIKGNIAYIPLGTNKKDFAIVDKKNAWIDKYPWCLASHKYPHTKIENKYILMHVLLYGKKEGLCIDHINRNKKDNRELNIRFVTRTINNRNISISKLNISGYTGISFSKTRKQWYAYITSNYKKISLGAI